MGNGVISVAIIKKALSIVPKLSPRIVMIDKNCAVIGYASGQNEHSFMQLVDNGMFTMDAALIDDGNDGLDDNNKVLGAVFLDMGMPLTREVTPGDIAANDQIESKRWDPFQRGGVIAREGFTLVSCLSSVLVQHKNSWPQP